MKIVLRTSTGWSGKVENKDKKVCDCCKSILWVAPSGSKYCDSVHTEEQVKKAEQIK